MEGARPSSEVMTRTGRVRVSGRGWGCSRRRRSRDFFGETLGRAAGEGRHAFCGEVGGEACGGFLFLAGLEGLHFVDAHVGCGDQPDGLDGGVLRADVAGHEAAHAVADENDVGGVGAELFRVGGVAQVGDGGLRVLNGVGEGEVAG